MRADDIVSKLGGVVKTSNGFDARCPAHEDKQASLSVTDGHKGLLLHCHAGCTLEQITAALDLKPADLFNGNGNSRPVPCAKRRMEATYDYREEDGNLLFQVVRWEGKKFSQRRPDGKGGWINNRGTKTIPFHLPQLISAVEEGRPIFVSEGEKDCLALEKAGFAATCNPGGAGKWQSSYSGFFRGAEVVIILDKDEPGRKHAADVAAKLKDVAGSVKVLELPDTNGKPVKDAHDFFAAGGTAVELDEIAQSAPIWSGEASKDDPWLELIEDGADLQAKELPPVVEIVKGIVAEQSKLSIVSSAKCFKTWTTIYMALAIAHGLEFLARPTTRRRVLYVNLELKPQTFTRRLQAIAKRLDIQVDRQWFFHLSLRGKLAGLTVHEIISRIIATAKRLNAQVVVCDPLFKLNIEGEENSSRDQTVFCNELDRLTTEGNCTAIFNDHSGKGNQADKDPLDVIRGSSAKGGDLDAAMVLRKHEVTACFRVDLIHRELAPVEPFVIGWRYPVMELRPDLSPDAMKKAKGGAPKKHDPEMLCAAISETTPENGVTITAWAAILAVSRQTLQGYLPGLRAKGWIATAGEGGSARQYLTEKGKQAAKRWAGKESE